MLRTGGEAALRPWASAQVTCRWAGAGDTAGGGGLRQGGHLLVTALETISCFVRSFVVPFTSHTR